MSEKLGGKRPCVSVIVAVYNVEAYIAECCHSLFGQTLDNMEYIFVDDCSKDNSVEVIKTVLKEYPKRVLQVKIVKHPENLGISRTREDGVKIANGEYIIHCDPDDWVELDMYAEMYNKAILEDADLVMSDFYYNYPDDPTSYIGRETPDGLTSASILASCLSAKLPLLHCFLWNKMIKSYLYRDVEWPYEVSCCEDMIVCVQIFRVPLNIYYINQAFYHYRVRRGSLSNRNWVTSAAENDLKVISLLRHYLCVMGDIQLYRFWQAVVPAFMVHTLKASHKVFTNKEYIERYRQYRSCIWKNRGLSFWIKMLLFCATYNYSIAYFIAQCGKKCKSILREVRQGIRF